jgi:hypothetical protein
MDALARLAELQMHPGLLQLDAPLKAARRPKPLDVAPTESLLTAREGRSAAAELPLAVALARQEQRASLQALLSQALSQAPLASVPSELREQQATSVLLETVWRPLGAQPGPRPELRALREPPVLRRELQDAAQWRQPEQLVLQQEARQQVRMAPPAAYAQLLPPRLSLLFPPSPLLPQQLPLPPDP